MRNSQGQRRLKIRVAFRFEQGEMRAIRESEVVVFLMGDENVLLATFGEAESLLSLEQRQSMKTN